MIQLAQRNPEITGPDGILEIVRCNSQVLEFQSSLSHLCKVLTQFSFKSLS